MGIVLTGSEVKAIREGGANLSDSYAAIERGELFLLECHISPIPTVGMPIMNPPSRNC